LGDDQKARVAHIVSVLSVNGWRTQSALMTGTEAAFETLLFQ
jgi:hypothetical protein